MTHNIDNNTMHSTFTINYNTIEPTHSFPIYPTDNKLDPSLSYPDYYDSILFSGTAYNIAFTKMDPIDRGLLAEQYAYELFKQSFEDLRYCRDEPGKCDLRTDRYHGNIEIKSHISSERSFDNISHFHDDINPSDAYWYIYFDISAVHGINSHLLICPNVVIVYINAIDFNESLRLIITRTLKCYAEMREKCDTQQLHTYEYLHEIYRSTRDEINKAIDDEQTRILNMSDEEVCNALEIDIPYKLTSNGKINKSTVYNKVIDTHEMMKNRFTLYNRQIKSIITFQCQMGIRNMVEFEHKNDRSQLEQTPKYWSKHQIYSKIERDRIKQNIIDDEKALQVGQRNMRREMKCARSSSVSKETNKPTNTSTHKVTFVSTPVQPTIVNEDNTKRMHSSKSFPQHINASVPTPLPPIVMPNKVTNSGAIRLSESTSIQPKTTKQTTKQTTNKFIYVPPHRMTDEEKVIAENRKICNQTYCNAQVNEQIKLKSSTQHESMTNEDLMSQCTVQ